MSANHKTLLLNQIYNPFMWLFLLMKVLPIQRRILLLPLKSQFGVSPAF